MNGHRRAAVALFGASRRDQKLILAALPEADRRILREHLHQLKALGFSQLDSGDLQRATDEPAVAATPEAPLAAPRLPLDRLRGASAERMAHLLATEPAALVAQVLAIENWPWAARVLDLLPRQRQTVKAGLHNQEKAGARDQFLIETLAARLERAGPVRAASVARTGRLKGMVNTWTR